MRILTLYSLLFILFVVPSVKVQAATNDTQALQAQITTLLQSISQLQAQLAALKPEATSVIANTTAEWGFDRSDEDEFYANIPIGGETYDEDDFARFFVVQNGKLYENYKKIPAENSIENQVWLLFKNIAGEDFVSKHVLDFATYDSKDDSVVAFVQYFNRSAPEWWMYREVETVDKLSYAEHNPGWGLGVNIVGGDMSNKKWVDYTISNLIHEYAHIVTLGEDQIYHDIQSKINCTKRKGTYLAPGKSAGCTMAESYLNTYVQKFWSASDITKAEHAHTTGKTKEFYAGRDSEFVTLYAATSPVEDIAESFTDFILQPKPTDELTIRNQKILFFYSYPELVTIRTHVRDAVKKYYQ